ncbi:universal stress protein [Piscinibacter sp.]|uniref:universal stress protein n=1 Tax=Piscinibacter sp. TaxID=1903157 RepID=UPI0039E243AF
MTPLRTLLAATDFSEASLRAVERAAQLAGQHGAALTLLHTLDALALQDMARWLGDEAGDAGADAGGVRDEARGRLHALAGELAARHAIAVAERLVQGHAVRSTREVAEQLQAELVLTGTRGAGIVRRMAVGSTAERIARRLARPVLMVRRAPEAAYHRVLLPVDFSPWSAGAIALAARVAPQAELLLMHAVELPFEARLRGAGAAGRGAGLYLERARLEARERLEALAAGAGLAPHRTGFVTPEGADPWMLIVRAEQERGCDLVAIGRQGRGALEEFLLGGTARMVLAEGGADVLLAAQGAAA